VAVGPGVRSPRVDAVELAPVTRHHQLRILIAGGCALAGDRTGSDRLRHHRGVSMRFSRKARSHFTNMTSVSITSWSPACISFIVEEDAGDDGSARPKPIW
jgi:hypothetical protein